MTLDTVAFQAAGSEVIISTYGGQVLSWRAADGIERLYTPDSLEIKPGHALRGGVPICFPQFANRGSVMKHGFARLLPWSVVERCNEKIVLKLSDNQYTRRIWNYRFCLEQHISLGENSLRIELLVMNSGKENFSFTNALHTYLRTENVLEVKLHGLNGVQYEDALRNNQLITQQQEAITLEDELDRVYCQAPAQILWVQSHQGYLLIEQNGFTDTVIWNPGKLKAAGLHDMPTEDWRNMLCIEAAVAAKVFDLPPGGVWSGYQSFRLR